MFTRGRSKDRTSRKVTPPGPSYMNNEQFANYLAELRDNRIARPGGARPLPSSTAARASLDQGNRRSQSTVPTNINPSNLKSQASTPAAISSTTVNTVPVPTRAESSMSHRRARSSISVSSRTGRALVQPPYSGPPLSPSVVVPSATYMERGQRWMEREEAYSLRDALEDMDLKKELEEEARLHAAAQEEASELVWQHQNPQAIRPPDAPYRYRDHLRKNSYQHARAQSVGPYTGPDAVPGLDLSPRSASNGSNISTSRTSQRDRVSSESSTGSMGQRQEKRASMDEPRGRETAPRKPLKSYGGLVHSIGRAAGRRQSNGRRNISGEVGPPFSADQIWEEPESTPEKAIAIETSDMPAPLRLKPRNPLNRVQFEQDLPATSNTIPLESTNLVSRTEIHKNPPSQSRNPAYTANPPLPVAEKAPEVPTKDGLEIRGEDIRLATSMKLKDRSPKLPTPTAVSDKPGRPIVSFDANWKPSEADLKPVEEPRRVRVESKFEATRPKYRIGGPRQTKSLPAHASQKTVAAVDHSTVQPAHAPGVKVDDVKDSLPKVNASPVDIPARAGGETPTISISEQPSIAVSPPKTKSAVGPPSISVAPRPRVSVAPPSISVSEPPSISVSGLPSISVSAPPAISVSGPPSIPVSGPPSISVSGPPSISVSGPPSISVSGPPSTSISAPPIPSIIEPSTNPSKPSARPLPNPKTARKNPFARPNRQSSHWSPAGPRATATCHACQLPIEGRVIALAGLPERWHPECMSCHVCGTALADFEISPEPPTERSSRLSRIAARAAGEEIPDVAGQTADDDGDDRLRFYCHLDWHEQFAPRCKHCTTPIIGEHVVALGAHWHYGHFFCAECGDPFARGQSHVELEGYAWCLACQTRRTERRAPRCGLCKGPVVGCVVQALGREFHEDCFRCGDCGGGFEDGQIFLREECGVCCTGCMERSLKA